MTHEAQEARDDAATVCEPQAVADKARAIWTEPFDSEEAHACEDELHRWVLRRIADGNCATPAACAEAALTSLDAENARRWYS